MTRAALLLPGLALISITLIFTSLLVSDNQDAGKIIRLPRHIWYCTAMEPVERRLPERAEAWNCLRFEKKDVRL